MKLQRTITSIGLFCISLGCMVGSGWLFGAFYAAQIAGPSAIISWLLGGALIVFIALTFSELSSMLPLAGGIARYSHFTHGPIVSFTMSWLAWLSCVAVAPTEVQSILQYASTIFPGLIIKQHGMPVLTLKGYIVATALMMCISWLNMMCVKWMTRLNSFLTCWKLVIPFLAMIFIAHAHFSAHNFVSHHFAPGGLHGILWSLPTAGIVFSFLGFREATSLAGEAKFPGVGIPLAVIGSVLICTLLYMLIQTVFIGALPTSALNLGWNHLHFEGDMGPFAGISTALGLGFLVLLIYADAQLSPLGTAFIYTGTTSRLNYAMSVNRYVPQAMLKLNRKGVPSKAILVNFVVGMLLFLPLPTWQALVGFQSTAIVLAYGIGPVALLVLRRHAADLKRPFQIPASKLFCMVTFMICNLIVYWTGWETIWRLMLCIGMGYILYFGYEIFFTPSRSLPYWHSSWWLLPYFLGLMLISYLGNFGGGLGIITFGWDFVVIAIFSLILMWIANRYCLKEKTLRDLLLDDSELNTYQHSLCDSQTQIDFEGYKV